MSERQTIICLVDGPDRRAFAEDEERPVSTVQVLRAGTFQHDWYGELTFDEALFDALVRNFEARTRGVDIAVDVEHRPEDGAAGWFRRLFKAEDGTALLGEVEWTPLGVELIRGGIYRYMSIEYDPDYVDPETGQNYGPTMLGAALTNRPFVKGMMPVNLSESGYGGGSDEEVEMKELYRALKLSDDATPEEALAAVQALAERAEAAEKRVRALEEEASRESAKAAALSEQVRALSEQVEQFRQTLHARDVEEAIEEAKREGKVTDGMLYDEQGNPTAFRTLADRDLDAWRAVVASLPATVALGERGTASAGPRAARGVVEVEQEIARLARQKQQENPKLSIGEATRLVLSERPELREAYYAGRIGSGEEVD